MNRVAQRPATTSIAKLVLPLAHPKSLNLVLRHLKKRYVLFLYSFAALVLHIAVVAYFADTDHYNFEMYTYWNFLLSLVLLGLEMLGTVFEGYFEGVVALILAPMTIGSAMLVPLIVSLVIFLDPAVYLNGTICAGGSMPMNKVRTGDWILHGGPILSCFFLLLFGYVYTLRAVLFHFNRSRHWFWSLLYALYFIFCPAIPMGLYAAIYDVAKHYPVPWPTWLFVLVCFVIDIVTQGLFYVALNMNTNETHVMVHFYPKEQAPLLPLRRVVQSTGRQRRPGQI